MIYRPYYRPYPWLCLYRLLYWSHYQTISRMGMDGSNNIDIVTTDVLEPWGLTVDFYSERIWWSDYDTFRIE